MTYVLFFIMCIAVQAIVLLIARKTKAHQTIYDLSPQSHQSKKMTPSFGGIGILVGVIAILLFIPTISPNVMWCVGLFAVFAFIGFVDDGLSFLRKNNRGLTARQKFFLQNIAAVVLLGAFSAWIRPLDLLEFGLFWFIVVGSSNATNLSDGLDGLLTGLSFFSIMGFYLYFKPTPDMAHFSLLFAVVLLSFLFFNAHPAKIFMGDTGSLPIGALFAGLALIAGNPWMLLSLGGVYIIETLSVMIQVAVYKWRGKRLFLMAPLHHHFELLGLSETKTVFLFWSFGALFMVLFILSL